MGEGLQWFFGTIAGRPGEGLQWREDLQYHTGNIDGEWIVARNKLITQKVRGSRAIYMFRSPIHSPWTQKKTLIP